MRTLVTVTVRANDCFVTASRPAGREGPYRQNGFMVRLPSSASDQDLGAAVLDALRSTTPPPDQPTGRSVEQTALGIRGMAAYMEGATSAYVDQAPSGLLQLTPTVNNGRRGGFVEQLDHISEVAADEPAVVGRAVWTALALAR